MIEDKLKVLFDTNILIDLLVERDGSVVDNLFYYEVINEVNVYISSKQITDVYYILRKYIKSKKKRYESIKYLIDFFCVIDLNLSDILLALQLKGPDLEDNVLISTSIRNNIDCILTNNIKDFRYCKNIKCLKPDELIDIIYG